MWGSIAVQVAVFLCGLLCCCCCCTRATRQRHCRAFFGPSSVLLRRWHFGVPSRDDLISAPPFVDLLEGRERSRLSVSCIFVLGVALPTSVMIGGSLLIGPGALLPSTSGEPATLELLCHSALSGMMADLARGLDDVTRPYAALALRQACRV